MNLILCTERLQWNAVVERYSPEQLSFLHSWEWGVMQTAFGRNVYRFIAREGSDDCAAVLCVVMPLPFGKTYFFSPYGPVAVNGATLDFHALSIALANTAEAVQNKAIFWRCEPRQSLPTGFGIRVHDIEPSTTRVLDLRVGEDLLLADMKQKTRYNIRLAEKKGVQTKWFGSGDTTDWHALAAQWWKLVSETSTRHAIHSHSQNYYELMMQTLGDAGVCEVGVASHDGDVLAMQICIGSATTNTYVHGASTNAKKELMAPYALQWSAIQRSCEQGYQWYDWYGVAPEGDEHHYLASVSRFKAGFGGVIRQYPGTFEIPFSQKWFTLYRIAKNIRS